jgi:hypothetical protein
MTVEGMTSVDSDPIYIGNTLDWLAMVSVVTAMKLPALSNAPLIGGVLTKDTIGPILEELPQLDGKVDERLLKGFKAALLEAQKQNSPLALV